jgi:hypothetical protein
MLNLKISQDVKTMLILLLISTITLFSDVVNAQFFFFENI